jgi:hypothetical protein
MFNTHFGVFHESGRWRRIEADESRTAASAVG